MAAPLRACKSTLAASFSAWFNAMAASVLTFSVSAVILLDWVTAPVAVKSSVPPTLEPLVPTPMLMAPVRTNALELPLVFTLRLVASMSMLPFVSSEPIWPLALRVTFWALMVCTPVSVIEPASIETLLLVAVMSPFRITALSPLVRLKPPGVVIVLSLSILLVCVFRFNALAVPFSVALSSAALIAPVCVTVPSAVIVSFPEMVEAPSTKALVPVLLSRSVTLLPLATDTAPVKLLPSLFSVMSLPAPTSNFVVPLTFSV